MPALFIPSQINDIQGLSASLASKRASNGLGIVDARDMGILPTNTAAQNKAALIAAFASLLALAPVCAISFHEPVPMGVGITVPSGIALMGSYVPVFKGTPPIGAQGDHGVPSGAAFLISDNSAPLFTFAAGGSNYYIGGFVFLYAQPFYEATSLSQLTTYPAAITNAGAFGTVEITHNCFVGATSCMVFTPTQGQGCSDLKIDYNYGFPLGGHFLRMEWVYDIPRVSCNHVNPSAGSSFIGGVSNGNVIVTTQIMDALASNCQPAFYVNAADEFVLDRNFVFGGNMGYRILNSYGQLTDCTADTVQTGLYVTLNDCPQKYVSVMGGNYIPNAGTGERNGVVFDGNGGILKVLAVNGFLGYNPAVPSTNTVHGANSVLQVNGTGAQRVDVFSLTKHDSGADSFVNLIDCSNTSAVMNVFPASDYTGTAPYLIHETFAESGGTTLTAFAPTGGTFSGGLGVTTISSGFARDTSTANGHLATLSVPRGVVMTMVVRCDTTPSSTVALDYTHCNGTGYEYIIRLNANSDGTIVTQLVKVGPAGVSYLWNTTSPLSIGPAARLRYTCSSDGTTHTLEAQSGTAYVAVASGTDSSPLPAGLSGLRRDSADTTVWARGEYTLTSN